MRRDGPWVAISCGLLRHPKLRKVDPLARLLYVAALCHSGDELTDGLVERDSLPFLYPLVGVTAREGASLVRQLERAGLWDVDADAGWRIRSYLDWNPDRASWERQREQNARRQRGWRERTTGEVDAKSARTPDEPAPEPGASSDGAKRQPSSVQAERQAGNASRNALRTPLRNGGDERETKEEQKQGTRGQAPRSAASAPEPIADEVTAALLRLQGPDGVPV